MSDITTVWTGTHGDFQVAGADLLAGDDLVTAVFISLFSDRVALPDDVIVDGTGDPRGWWADVSPDFIGSRLWLLERSKRLQSTLGDAQAYAEEALQWLVDDGVAAGFDVYCEWQTQSMLGMRVSLFKANGTTQAINFSWAWTGIN